MIDDEKTTGDATRLAEKIEDQQGKNVKQTQGPKDDSQHEKAGETAPVRQDNQGAKRGDAGGEETQGIP